MAKPWARYLKETIAVHFSEQTGRGSSIAGRRRFLFRVFLLISMLGSASCLVPNFSIDIDDKNPPTFKIKTENFPDLKTLSVQEIKQEGALTVAVPLWGIFDPSLETTYGAPGFRQWCPKNGAVVPPLVEGKTYRVAITAPRRAGRGDRLSIEHSLYFIIKDAKAVKVEWSGEHEPSEMGCEKT